MKRYTLYLLLSVLFVTIFFDPVSIPAAPFYQGKRVTFIVGFAPGGGSGNMMQMLSKHLPKYIPGKPGIIVQYMPGGSSMIAANYVYKVAAPDGLTIAIINRGLQVAQLMKIEGIEFDLRKFAWVGSTASDSSVLCIRNDLPFKNFTDLKNANREIYMSSGGPMTSGAQFATLVKEFIKINIRIITYANKADALLAVERKEVDGTAGTFSSLRPLIERGVMHPVLRGRNSDPEILNLPVDEDMTTDKIGKKIMAMASAADRVGRPFVAVPGTPQEAMVILRNAFAKVAKDPQVQADARKNMVPVEYLPAEDCVKAVSYILDQPPDVVNEFKKYIKY